MDQNILPISLDNSIKPVSADFIASFILNNKQDVVEFLNKYSKEKYTSSSSLNSIAKQVVNLMYNNKQASLEFSQMMNRAGIIPIIVAGVSAVAAVSSSAIKAKNAKVLAQQQASSALTNALIQKQAEIEDSQNKKNRNMIVLGLSIIILSLLIGIYFFVIKREPLK